jgi:CrcB protein
MAPDRRLQPRQGPFLLAHPFGGGEGVPLDVLWVGLGGGAGAMTRYLLGLWIAERLGTAFPWSTWTINVSGSLVIGLLLTVLTEKVVVDPAWRLLLVVGFLGGYTTFSSYTFEALTLARAGEWLDALAYVLGSNLVGLAAVTLGAVVAHLVWR